MEAIKIIELTKKYKDLTAVDRLNLTIESGELFSLLGVNGAGKTTTIKMLSCLTKPTNGDAVLLGKSIVIESAAVKEIIAVSPQETAVAPNLTVKENLELMAGVHGFSREKSNARVCLHKLGRCLLARYSAFSHCYTDADRCHCKTSAGLCGRLV